MAKQSSRQQNAARTKERRKGQDRLAPRIESVEIDSFEQFSRIVLTGPSFSAKSAPQKRLYNALKSRECPYVVADGPAGVGKTYVEVSYALEEMAEGRIEKIYITRPAREVKDEDMGFLPGELSDKFEPYLTPILEVMQSRLHPGMLKYLRRHQRIEAVPIGFMRGRTFKDCVFIVDEAQNTTPEQMKMMVTRLGENAKMVINGDPEQTDIRGPSGLTDVRRLLATGLMKRVEFVAADSVRTGFMAEVLAAYES